MSSFENDDESHYHGSLNRGDLVGRYRILEPVGASGSSTNFILGGTVGQTAVRFSSSTNFGLNSGFWQTFVTGCCVGIRGNIDGDPADQINIADLVYLVDYSFSQPPGPDPPCPEEADVNGDGTQNIADIVYMVEYMFSQPPGPAPVACP